MHAEQGLLGDLILKSDRKGNGSVNQLEQKDLPFHDWYRFVLSYPAHLVRDYLRRFELPPGSTVLDPFSGTGTTLVEAKLNGFVGVGMEVNPIAYLAGKVKTTWDVDPTDLTASAKKIASLARRRSRVNADDSLRGLSEEQEKLLISGSISPLPLHKCIILGETIDEKADPAIRDHLRLAFAKTAVGEASNLCFGPEIGVSRKKKTDVDVISAWLSEIAVYAYDIENRNRARCEPCYCYNEDARAIGNLLEHKIDAVITSPPYPNEKDYTRTTRLENVLLGFLNDRDDLRALKKGLLRSNTRNVYKGDDDDQWVSENAAVQQIAEEIERRRIELGKTSGFERMYHRVTKQYFGGMARHFESLKQVLNPGAYLAYVVGDQASYLRVMIRTGELLSQIAEELGFEPVAIDLFRTRLATATKMQMREEVVVLRWPG